MEYVMVPVPEELVEDVKAYLAWEVAATNPDVPENPTALTEIFAAADPVLRALLVNVATATADDIRPTLSAAAADLDIGTRELMGLLIEVNHRLLTAGGSGAAIYNRPDHREKPEDIEAWEHRMLHMSTESAAQILPS